MRTSFFLIFLSTSTLVQACDERLCWEPQYFVESAGNSGWGLALGLGVAALAGGGGGGSDSSASSISQIRSVPIFGESATAGDAGVFETQEYRDSQGLPYIRASSTWSVGGLGDSVRVQVFDTGLETSHPEFSGRAFALTDHTGTGGVQSDSDGHGTAMAGIIAGALNNRDSVGVAPNAEIYGSKIFDDLGGSSASELRQWLPSAIAQGQQAGVHILNNSWGSEALITQRSASFLRSVYGNTLESWQGAVDSGQVVVFAAGNESGNAPSLEAGLPLRFPALTPGWLAVTAIDEQRGLADYANACGIAGTWCLAAPGFALTTGLNGNTAVFSGTSVAAAYASGSLAALISAFPEITNQQARQRLLDTATSGSIELGQGIIDLDAALSPVGELSVLGAPADNVAVQLSPTGDIAGLAALTIQATDQQGFGFNLRVPTWSDSNALASDGLLNWELAGASFRDGDSFAIRTARFGIARLDSPESMHQWLSPQRWGSQIQGHPGLHRWGDSYVIDRQLSGSLSSRYLAETDGSQMLSSLRWGLGESWLDLSVHNERKGFAGFQVTGLSVADSTTVWIGAGASLNRWAVQWWEGIANPNGRLDMQQITYDAVDWQFALTRPTAVTRGGLNLVVPAAGEALGELRSAQQFIDLSVRDREHRIGATKWFPGAGVDRFIGLDYVHNLGHRRGDDVQMRMGLLRRF